MSDLYRASVDALVWFEKNGDGNVAVSKALRKALSDYVAPVQSVKQEPVAWRTFEGEAGCYDYRGYEDNESYLDDFIKRNGDKYASWVEPLNAAPVDAKTIRAEA